MTEHEDFFLQRVVLLANKHSLSLSITLLVSGLAVSGELIGGAEYYKGQGDALKSISPGEGSPADVIGDFWIGFSSIYENKPEDAEEENSTNDSLIPSYIHLKNVKILSGTNLFPSSPLNFWRGKISSVDGFYIGAFS